MAVSGAGQSETPQSLAAPAFAGFLPIAENGIKVALTTGMTTDRKIVDFRGIFLFFVYCGADVEFVILNISFRQVQT